MDFKGIPQQSVIYLLICLSGVIIFIALGILPTQRTLSELNGKIAETKVRIEEQKTLVSIYQTLKQRAQKKETQKQGARTLFLPVKAAPERVEMERLTATVEGISRRANLQMISLAPALSSLGGDSKTMAVEMVVRGEFHSFRRILIGLGELPYIDHVEEMQFQQNQDGTELRVKFWVNRL